MSPVVWALTTLAALVVLVIGKVTLDLANKEIQGWMYDTCFIILRATRKRLPPKLRGALYDDERLEDELRTILFHTYEKKPITALWKGFRFAMGCLAGARRHAQAAGWRLADADGFGRRRRRRIPQPKPMAIMAIGTVGPLLVLYASKTAEQKQKIPDWLVPDWLVSLMLILGALLNLMAIGVTALRKHLRRTQHRAQALQAVTARHRHRRVIIVDQQHHNTSE